MPDQPTTPDLDTPIDYPRKAIERPFKEDPGAKKDEPEELIDIADPSSAPESGQYEPRY